MNIGFLHPGEMGVSLAASALNSGHTACWTPAGRSEATRTRAGEHGLTALPSLEALCAHCSILIAVCPPHAALEQARAVIAAGFRGLYADVNAIAPQKVRHIGEEMERAGIGFVDGGIIGLPAWQPRSTWLYLSGPRAADVAPCFRKGPLETEILGEEVGRASALKMCFAANTKGTTALLAAILGAAESLGVREALETQWDRFEPGSAARTHQRLQGAARKAWRFTGEMGEIAETLEAAGMPGGFHHAAGEIYARLGNFKDCPDPSSLEILKALSVENRKD